MSTADRPPGLDSALGTGEEFDRVRAIWRRVGTRGMAGGDDAAIISLDGVPLAVSTDLSIEGTHFEWGWMAPADIGWRAATAAFSDLAAMAAVPRGLLVSLAASAELPIDHTTEVMDGAAEAARAVGAVLWGGDLVRGDRFTIDVTVLGSVSAPPVYRRGARPGQRLMVTGHLGGPGHAVRCWTDGREPDAWSRQRFCHPEARVDEAQWLRERGATAMIDVSDGLVADAGHLAAASSVQCVLDLDRLPPSPTGLPVTRQAASGEEYELLVAMPGAEGDALERAFAEAFGIPITTVGSVERGEGVTVREHGGTVDIATWRHF